jgi:hypothetical protein
VRAVRAGARLIRAVAERAARAARAGAGYSGTPLPKKLGIREGMRVRLVGAPPGFERTLGALPADARTVRRGAGEMTIWFVRRRAALADLPAVKAALGPGGLWMLWQKRTSGFATDVDEAAVRAAGLAHGLVDFKICAVDERWSGLRFAVRRDGR